MLSRRLFLTAGVAATISFPSQVLAAKKKFNVNPKYLPQTVRFRGYKPGLIIVDPRNHFLYLTMPRGRARRYGVGVGRAGLAFKGSATIKRKAKWPSWRPTDNMIRRDPKRYKKFAKGVPGGPNNPLGARALYLYKGKRDTYFRIHGTNKPSSIGRSVSAGCIRMINDHVVDLYTRVPIGTKVIVI